MKTKIGILLVLLAISSCGNPSSNTPNIKEGMIQVAILYPNGENKTFDMEYYATKHMPMAADLFGDALRAMEIEKGIANNVPDTPVPYLAIGYFYFDTLSDVENAMGPNSKTLRADVLNYTNIKPIIQINEVRTITYY